MAGKVKRLSKVARELNVGISTIVDFLGTQGVEIDSSPNTKISPEHFDKLSEQFAADQSLKEAANKTALKREKRETITLASNAKPEAKEQPETEDDIDVHETIAKVKSEDQKTPETPKVEETPAPAEKETPKAEEVKEEKKAEEAPKKEETPVNEDKSPQITKEDSKTLGGGDMKVQVLGKIDLGSINTKTRPDKRKKGDKKPVQKKEETPVAQAPKKETPKPTPVVKPIEAKKEEPKEEVKAPKREEVETIKVERKKLTGPTVVGKIELPVEKKKTSSADNKRKRKRIKKVDVNKQASKTRTTSVNQVLRELVKETKKEEVRKRLTNLKLPKKISKKKSRKHLLVFLEEENQKVLKTVVLKETLSLKRERWKKWQQKWKKVS